MLRPLENLVSDRFALHRRHAGVLAVAALLLAGTAIGATVVSLRWMHAREIDERLDDAGRTLEAVVRHVAARYETLDAATRRFVELIGNRDPATMDADELADLRGRVDRPYAGIELLSNVWLPDGRSALPDTRDVSVADRSYFRVHADPTTAVVARAYMLDRATGLAIGEPVHGRIRDQLILPATRALRAPDGRLLAVVGASVPVRRMLEEFELIQRDPNDALLLLRSDGTVLVRLPFDGRGPDRALADAAILEDRPNRPAGRFEAASERDGSTRTGIRKSLDPLPLVAAISLETSAFWVESLHRFLPVIAISVFQLMATIAFAIVAFITLTRALRERDRTEASEARLRGVLETASDGIVILDSAMRIRGFNAAAERMFGRLAADVVGGPLDPLIPPAQRKPHVAHVAGFAAGSVRARQMRDWRVVNGLHSDGSKFPLMAAISKAEARGEPIYLAVVRDMSEAAAAETRLVEAAHEAQRLRQVAEQASQAKSLFLATMSHELRTPLNAIIGFSEAIRDGIAGPVVSEQQREYLGYVVTSGRHLLEIINDIIDISRLQSGTHAVHLDTVGIAETVDLAFTMLRHRFEQKGVAFAVEPAAPDIDATADVRALRQILINVLGNAIKFSPAGGRVACAWTRDGDRVRIRVRDEGPGMSREVLENVGNPFNQDRDLLRTNNEGVGLGLSISMALAREMGGRLEFENLPHGGLEVTVELAAAPAGDQTAEPSAAK